MSVIEVSSADVRKQTLRSTRLEVAVAPEAAAQASRRSGSFASNAVIGEWPAITTIGANW
jgi:hypothetical protein